MNTSLHPKLLKAKKVIGNKLAFRDITIGDASFILGLRTDEYKSRYLNSTVNDLERQKKWLDDYAKSEDQAYFIIESLSGRLMGAVRLYDPRGKSFCWGSWILIQGAPQAAAIESALMVYSYALDHLGFSGSHFDVRKGNERVWRFHERFGARRVGESEIDYFYEINTEEIRVARAKYKKYLPENIRATGVKLNAC
jgi:RimJ/RimL family protein N-acetyltransferase